MEFNEQQVDTLRAAAVSQAVVNYCSRLVGRAFSAWTQEDRLISMRLAAFDAWAGIPREAGLAPRDVFEGLQQRLAGDQSVVPALDAVLDGLPDTIRATGVINEAIDRSRKISKELVQRPVVLARPS